MGYLHFESENTFMMWVHQRSSYKVHLVCLKCQESQLNTSIALRGELFTYKEFRMFNLWKKNIFLLETNTTWSMRKICLWHWNSLFLFPWVLKFPPPLFIPDFAMKWRKKRHNTTSSFSSIGFTSRAYLLISWPLVTVVLLLVIRSGVVLLSP